MRENKSKADMRCLVSEVERIESSLNNMWMVERGADLEREWAISGAQGLFTRR